MTDNEIRIAMAELDGRAGMFVLMRRGLYYRPNAGGYTSNPNEAWVGSEDVAANRVYSHDEPVTKHPAPLPDYLDDLNAVHEVENKMINKIDFWVHLVCTVNGLEIQMIVRDFTVPEMYKASYATARQRCEAILRTLGKWKD